MKKLIYPVLFFFAVSCNRENSPTPNAAPDISKLANQQAPFGAAASDVKLRKVSQDGRLSVEYIYDGDLLGAEKRYDVTYIALYQKGTFTRVNNLPESYVVASAYHDSQTDSSTTYKPFYSLSYAAPKNDSVRQVRYERYDGTEVHNNIYTFDKEGYITKQEIWTNLAANTADLVTYARDSQHNVTKTKILTVNDPNPESWVEYTYDNHPNPFFKIGRDWGGDISVRSLSPHNLTRETYKNGIGVTSNIYYTYEYLPNGYPKKVTIRVESVNYSPWSYSIDFIY